MPVFNLIRTTFLLHKFAHIFKDAKGKGRAEYVKTNREKRVRQSEEKQRISLIVNKLFVLLNEM